MSDHNVIVNLTQLQDYQFKIEFGQAVPAILGDEPAPLGQGTGPSPVQLLAAAVGNCLSDSPCAVRLRPRWGATRKGMYGCCRCWRGCNWVSRLAPWRTWIMCWITSRRIAPSRKAWGKASRLPSRFETPKASCSRRCKHEFARGGGSLWVGLQQHLYRPQAMNRAAWV
jgi:hypothetical protein